MTGKVKLETVEGASKGRRFEFTEHDTFILGRMPDCHICLPEDPLVSRHHFIIEVSPPEARIRDLGSMNGTYVNGARHGGREEHETPEEGAKRKYPEVDLKDGDRIAVGSTEFVVKVDTPAFCCECGLELTDQKREQYMWIGGTFICPKCKAKGIAAARPPQKLGPVRCQKCGRDVSREIGGAAREHYICNLCRMRGDMDLKKMLEQMLGARRALQPRGEKPSIEGYDIGTELGRGAMGAVYKATRKKDGKLVAIKVMLSKVAVNDKSRAMFQREFDIGRQLHHENIVQFIDNGSVGDVFYFVQEFCDGGSVEGLMKQHGGKLPLTTAKPITLQILRGLAYAHEAQVQVTMKDGSKIDGKGVVHRDLKPGNILLSGGGGLLMAKIGDFGLAKCFDTAGLSGMTMTGQMAGTPGFMPREQVVNYKDVKPVSDVWSIAATFYNMLTAKLPRDARPGQDPISMVLSAPIVPIRKRDATIPHGITDVIDRALSVSVTERYQDAGEMLKAMQKAM